MVAFLYSRYFVCSYVAEHVFPFCKLYFLFSCVTDGYENESTIKTHENSYRICPCFRWSEGRLASIHSCSFTHVQLCSTWLFLHMVLTCLLVGWMIGIYTGLFPVFQRLSYPNWKEKKYSLFKTSLWSDCRNCFLSFYFLEKFCAVHALALPMTPLVLTSGVSEGKYRCVA